MKTSSLFIGIYQILRLSTYLINPDCNGFTISRLIWNDVILKNFSSLEIILIHKSKKTEFVSFSKLATKLACEHEQNTKHLSIYIFAPMEPTRKNWINKIWFPIFS
jgi:hypothetical protein